MSIPDAKGNRSHVTCLQPTHYSLLVVAEDPGFHGFKICHRAVLYPKVTSWSPVQLSLGNISRVVQATPPLKKCTFHGVLQNKASVQPQPNEQSPQY